MNKFQVILRPQVLRGVINSRFMSSQMGDAGSGAGKGGGGGGSIRDAGGAFGKRQAGQEEEFFYKKRIEQLSELKDNLISDEIIFYEEQIQVHNEAISRIKQRVADINKK